jgi:ComF family protein
MVLAAYWNAFIDIVYPPKCPACKTLVQEHGAWCSQCLSEILAVREINISEHHLKYLASCRAICEYSSGLKRLIHDMKFRQQKRYAVYLRWLLLNYVYSDYFINIDYVIPVPLHSDRLKERGYDQTEVIFKTWAEKQKMLWMSNVLVRSKYTVPQWKLPLAERKQNIKGAFLVTRPDMVLNKTILLVDDIFTTGITLEECAKVLKQAGASNVCALAIASGAR